MAKGVAGSSVWTRSADTAGLRQAVSASANKSRGTVTIPAALLGHAEFDRFVTDQVGRAGRRGTRKLQAQVAFTVTVQSKRAFGVYARLWHTFAEVIAYHPQWTGPVVVAVVRNAYVSEAAKTASLTGTVLLAGKLHADTRLGRERAIRPDRTA